VQQICADLAISMSDLACNDSDKLPINTQNVLDVLIMHRSYSVCLILHNTAPVLQICADLVIRMADLAHNILGKLPMNSHNVQDVLITHRLCSVCADLTVNTSYAADLCRSSNQDI
jgi:energy-converting hydrogenase A subunit M